jgi:hypothetical protein
MPFEQIRLDRPLSRLELGVAVIIIGLCFAGFLRRMEYLEAVGEATALDLSIRNIRTGIMLYVSTRVLQGDRIGIAELAGANPVGSAIEPPPGYIGSLSRANPDFIRPGQWYFDEDQAVLCYHIVNADYFETPETGPARVRMRLKLNYDDVDGDGVFDQGSDVAESISLELLDPVRWNF